MIPFLQLTPGEDAAAVRESIDRVITRAAGFVLGPELEAFETEFAAACAAPHAVGVGTGTDAIALALRGFGNGPRATRSSPPRCRPLTVRSRS